MIQYNMYVLAEEREKEVELYHTNMKNYPVSEKPFEKAKSEGLQVLSDAELLALILRTGSKELNVIEVCRYFLQSGHQNLLNLYDCSNLIQIFFEFFNAFNRLIKFRNINKIECICLCRDLVQTVTH